MSTAVSATQPGSRFIQSLLLRARQCLHMDVAFIGEFIEGRRVLRFVDSETVEPSTKVGDSESLEQSLCQRVVDARLPGLITDVAAVAEAAALPSTTEMGIGSYIGVPVVLSDGSSTLR